MGNLEKGKRHGLGSLYYRNGILKYEGIFKSGVCDNIFKDFNEEGNDKNFTENVKSAFSKAKDLADDYF